MKCKGMREMLFLVLALSLMLSGCAQMKEKFIRKPKEVKRMRTYRLVREYTVHPSIELYTKRYMFWKNWHRELLAVLRDENHKKRLVAMEQAISNLIDMRNMLTDEKYEEFQVLIDEMEKISNFIKEERLTRANETKVRRRLESTGRKIMLDFSYNKMKGFIRSDFRE